VKEDRLSCSGIWSSDFDDNPHHFREWTWLVNRPMEVASEGGDIGVFFANGIGDHIMVLPALRALLSALPQRVALFTAPDLRHVVLDDLIAAREVPIHLSMVDGRNHFNPEIGLMLSGEIGLFISLNPWHSIEVDQLLENLRPSLTVGMSKKFDIWVKPLSLEHSSDRAFRVATAIDPTLKINDFTQAPSLSSRAILAADKILDQVPDSCHVMTVHNDTLAHKVWSPHRLAKTLSTFMSSRKSVYALVVDRGGPELQLLRHLPRVIVPTDLPLDVALALVSRSDLFLGIDSCMLHMADLCRVPGVGLFGPDSSQPLGSGEMGFRFGPHQHVNGNGSMGSIHTTAVLQCLDELASLVLGATPARQEISSRGGRLAVERKTAGRSGP
jgi:hypothetical protein